MPEHDDQDDFWGPDDTDERPSRRRQATTSSTSRKVVPIVAAAAVLLLIVVIFLVARNSSDDNKGKSASATDSTASSSGSTSDSSTAPTTKTKASQWPSMLDFPPPVFDNKGKSATEPQPGSEAKPGVYVWESFDGWQVRIVPGDGIGRVTGSVTGAQGTSVGTVTNAAPGVARLDGTDVVFDVPPTNAVVSISFTLGFYTNSTALTLNGDQGPLDKSLIFIGHGAVPVAANPMIFQKAKR